MEKNTSFQENIIVPGNNSSETLHENNFVPGNSASKTLHENNIVPGNSASETLHENNIIPGNNASEALETEMELGREFGHITYPSTRRGWVFRGLRDGFPICLGYFAVAFALGIEAKRVGLTAFQSFLMSTGMVASAGEFAALLLIESHAGVIEMITTCIIVNLRYFLMSCSLSQKLKPAIPAVHRFGVAYCITDEIFGLSSAVPDYLEPFYSYAITVISVLGWSGGTVMGVLVGSILPAMAVNALSVSLYGMFLAIIIPPAKENHFIGGLVAVSMAVSWVFSVLPLTAGISSGFKVIILTILLAGAAAYLKPIEMTEETD
jgi:predicted branched-subunit amino acid permease